MECGLDRLRLFTVPSIPYPITKTAINSIRHIIVKKVEYPSQQPEWQYKYLI